VHNNVEQIGRKSSSAAAGVRRLSRGHSYSQQQQLKYLSLETAVPSAASQKINRLLTARARRPSDLNGSPVGSKSRRLSTVT